MIVANNSYQCLNNCNHSWLPRSRLPSLVLTVLMSLFLLSTGCSKRADHTVVVFACSSLIEPLEALEDEFESTYPETDIQFVYAGSQTLAMQINEGARADIFISADKLQIEKVPGFSQPSVLVENEVIGVLSSANFASNLDAATRDAKRIIIAHNQVPIGHYTKEALEQSNLWNRVEPKVVSYEDSARSVLTKAMMGEADLAFIYRTDAGDHFDENHIIEFPDIGKVTTQTWISQRGSKKDPNTITSQVYDFLLNSNMAHSQFQHFGFNIPSEAP